MNNKRRDIFLLLIVAVLVALAIIPTQKTDTGSVSTTSAADKAISAPGVDSSSLLEKKETHWASEPAVDIDHELWPIVPGSTWLYRVHGSPRLTKADRWSIEVKSFVKDTGIATLEVGYPDNHETGSVWLKDGTIKTDIFPIQEPIEYLGNKPKTVTGVLFPNINKASEGAVWEELLNREVLYEYRDDGGRIHRKNATATQRNRAIIEDFETIIVPAGNFKAFRISWTSRIEMQLEGRPILDGLTSSIFRKELMWVAPGVGIVRRSIEYPGFRASKITFELLKYYRPTG